MNIKKLLFFSEHFQVTKHLHRACPQMELVLLKITLSVLRMFETLYF